MTAQPQSLVGTVLGGKYLLESVRGAGGMGAVYKATHLILDSPVAVKVLHAQYSRDEGYRRRFEREARVLSKLKHPSAVQVHDFGLHDGLLYLVMEFIDGISLRDLLRERGLSRLPYPQVYNIAQSLAGVLVAAHTLKLVHRDLKPENVIVERLPGGQERVVVVDFGLAFLVDDVGLGRMTETGVVVGTPLYVSPEQAEGSSLDPSTDIYSLGCILYELCAGRPPFLGKSSVQILNSHLFNDPPPLRTVATHLNAPEPFTELVMKMLNKKKEERPSASAISGLLEYIRPNEGVTTGLLDATPASAPALEGEADTLNLGATVLIPRQETESSAAATELTPAPPPPQSNGRVGFINYPIGFGLLQTFSASGLSCHLFNEDERYAVVFAPEATPDDVFRLVRRGLVVLAASPRNAPDRAAELKRAGAAEVVDSPVDEADLARKIARVARRASRAR